MTRPIARRGGRRVGGEPRPFFYNPMWRFYGDRPEGPSGTYYVARGGHEAYFWHMFDQVLVRPDLIDHLCDVRIVHQVGPVSLLRRRTGTPDRSIGSDHLPLAFALNV